MIPQGWNGLSLQDAQATCGFSCLASKCAPFFQIVSVIAAIFRANVRRAIPGFIPWLSKPWYLGGHLKPAIKGHFKTGH